MNYKNAEKCHKCPQSNGENGCPWWWELMECNDGGQERLHKTCGKVYLPVILVEVMKASNRPAAELSAMRQDMSRSMSRAVEVTMQKVAQMGPDALQGQPEDDQKSISQDTE